MRFAPEGIPFIVAALMMLMLLGCVSWVLDSAAGWMLPFIWLPVALWVPWFFRNPPRGGPRGENLVTAPADGRVVTVTEETDAEFIGGPATRISIFMNVFNVHVNRYPVDGTVEYREYTPGKFLNASLDKASSHNERMSLGISTPRGRVLVKQIAGLIARRIVTDGEVGDDALQGGRLGLIRFGSRVDTLLPPEVVPKVSVGDRTIAGMTVIAEWNS